MTAGEIAAMFAHAWQTTTRHLQVLEAAGLLTHERQGRMRIYRIERKRLALVTDWLAHFQGPVRHLSLIHIYMFGLSTAQRQLARSPHSWFGDRFNSAFLAIATTYSSLG